MAATHARKPALVASLALVPGILLAALMGPAATTAGAQTAKASGCKAAKSHSGKAASRTARVRRQRRCSTSPATQPTGGSTQASGSTQTSAGSGASGSGSNTPNNPPANPDCPLSQPGSQISMTLPSACTVVASDTATSADPLPFWGKVEAQSAGRHQRVSTDGDTHSTGNGASQANTGFRRLTAFDGDDYYGERAELGFNNMNGPTAFYREGQRRVTFISLRLPSPTNPEDSLWRTALQMKQTQPYNNPNVSPVFELQVRGGVWVVESSWTDLWTAPARQNTWTRFAFDITYSQDPAVGSIKTYVDLNDDGDFSDVNEQSPVIRRATLRAETLAGGYSPYAVGESIPSHLRAGVYHNPNYSCPSGCSVDLDNVQIIRA